MRCAAAGYYIARRVTFQTLNELVEHYKVDSDGLCAPITKPCSKTELPQTAGLSIGMKDQVRPVRWSLCVVCAAVRWSLCAVCAVVRVSLCCVCGGEVTVCHACCHPLVPVKSLGLTVHSPAPPPCSSAVGNLS